LIRGLGIGFDRRAGLLGFDEEFLLLADAEDVIGRFLFSLYIPRWFNLDVPILWRGVVLVVNIPAQIKKLLIDELLPRTRFLVRRRAILVEIRLEMLDELIDGGLGLWEGEGHELSDNDQLLDLLLLLLLKLIQIEQCLRLHCQEFSRILALCRRSNH
jgi:hypothetical protein